MATYQEIFTLRSDPTLLARFVVAVEIAAAGILKEDAATENHAPRLAWAKRAFLQDNRSQDYATRIMRLAMSSQKDIADLIVAAQISDAQIQGVVNGYVNPLALAGI